MAKKAQVAQKLDVLSAGLALGCGTAIYLLFIGFCAMWFGWGVDCVKFIGNWYFGYDATVVGSFIGALWGLIDGFIGGVIIAWLYNKFTALNKR